MGNLYRKGQELAFGLLVVLAIAVVIVTLVSYMIYNSNLDKYFYTILMNGRIVKANEQSTTYEEAELACLKKLIKIVKTNHGIYTENKKTLD